MENVEFSELMSKLERCIAGLTSRTQISLPHRSQDEIKAELNYNIFELYLKFDFKKNIPLEVFVVHMLRIRMNNWISRELSIRQCELPIDYLSHQQNFDEDVFPFEFVDTSTIANFEDMICQDWFKMATAHLTLRQFETIKLHFSGWTEREIAQHLEIDHAAVHRHIGKAKIVLRKKFLEDLSL